MSRGFGSLNTTKSCKCEIRDKINWYKDHSLVVCNKCGNQWYTQAKYKIQLKDRKEFFKS